MILAQVNWEQAGAAAVVVIAALGGQRGLEALIVAWRGKRNGQIARNDNAKVRYMPETQCLLRHTELEKRQDERQATMLKAVEDVRDSIVRLHDRIDKMH